MQQVAGRTRPLSFDAGGSGTLLRGGAETPWAGVPIELHRTVPGETQDTGPVSGQYAMVAFLAGTVEITANRGGRDVTHRSRPGSVSFLSGDEPVSSRVTGSADVAAILVTPEWFHRIGLERAPAGFGRTPPLADDNARALMSAMRCELLDGAGRGRLYAESLSLAFLSYVLGSMSLSPARERGALSDTQCRRLVEHVRARLGEQLSVAELAAVAGVGVHPFSKLFRASFGITPYRYVLHQRLEEGARRLVLGREDVAEIALAVGFSSQSHFAAAFRKRFGQTPLHYAAAHGRRSRRP